MKLVGRGLSSFPSARVTCPVFALHSFHCHTYREQVEQVCVGVDAGRGVLDEC